MDGLDRVNRLRTALAALDSAQYGEAQLASAEVLAVNPTDIEALLLLALAMGLCGDLAEAAPLLHQVSRARPQHSHPCQDLAALLARADRAAEIPLAYRACLSLAPDDTRLSFALAEFLREAGDPVAALQVLQPLLDGAPGNAELQFHVGLATAESGRFAEASEHFRTAVALDPAPAAFWANLGMVLKVEGQFDEALAAYHEALRRAPEDRQIRVNRAVARLHAGRYPEAWQDEEWRLTQPGQTALPPERLLPPISRLPNLTGRTVLVVQEEGFGDSLQFMRYLPLLARRGARIVVAVPRELARLMRRMEGVAEVPEADAPIPAHDFHTSFNGLPRAFETTLETIPQTMPYLTAEPGLAAAWAKRLAGPELRVGLVWAGQARPWLPGYGALDGHRSTHLATLAPLAAVAGVQFVSLQKGAPARELHNAPLAILDPMGEVRDFEDTAAIVANLDLVISVDTSVAHLAGAMGRPVFLLDRYDNCWRWLSGREDSPWYPTLRIFRQQRSGEWAPVVKRVAQALRAFAAARARPFPPPQVPDAA